MGNFAHRQVLKSLIHNELSPTVQQDFIGISSQGPGEDACISQFKKLSLTYGSVGNFRLGE